MTNSSEIKTIHYNMAWYVAIFLGLLQGLTEFLPVSSSGHLLMVQHFLNMPENMLMFNIMLHLATLTAVVIVFRNKIWSLIRKPFCRTNLCLLVATAITCTFVLLFKGPIDAVLTYKVLPVTFLITAIMLFLTSFVSATAGSKQRNPFPNCYGSAVAGLAQGIAVAPGISRSGATIAACLFMGAKREDAAEFSFLMSIPIIIASFLYELIGNSAPISVEILPLGLAFVAALISGIIAIKIMLTIVRRVKLYWFSAYLAALSIMLLIFV